AFPVAAFESPSELRRRRGNLDQRATLKVDFELERRGLPLKCGDLLPRFHCAPDLRAGGVRALATAGHNRQLLAFNPQALDLGDARVQFSFEGLNGVPPRDWTPPLPASPGCGDVGPRCAPPALTLVP